MISFIIDWIRDLRGWQPKASPMSAQACPDLVPYKVFKQQYPYHPASKMEGGPIRPWKPKAGDWRCICRALKDMQKVLPSYESDANLVWEPSDRNCVGRALSIYSRLGYAGVPAHALALLACRVNGGEHVLVGINLPHGWCVVDMYDESPKDWADSGIRDVLILSTVL